MGLRCSLMGHDFGEVEVDRTREERGSEVIVTITEFERCRRCGTTTVVSENTEVTTTDAASPGDGDEAETAVIREVEEREDERTPPPEPTEDDGIILEDEPEEDPERAYGEWPASPDDESPDGDEPAEWPASPGEDDPTTDDDPAEWPAVTGDDEGFDAVAPGGVEPEEGTETELEQGPTEARPTESDARADAAAAGDASTSTGNHVVATDAAAEGDEFVRAGDAPVPTESSTDATGPTEIYCPNCGSKNLGQRHSLRAGDICPECHAGYVAEREI